MQRRTFFKVSGTLAVTLIAWRQGVLVPAQKIRNQISEFHFLEKSDIEFLKVCLPCLLPFRAWDVPSMANFSSRLDATVALMEPSVQIELRQLFDLFDLTPIRWWLGLSRPASAQQLALALDKMQHSRFSDLRAAAFALGEIITGVYYSDPKTYRELGYAPPLEAW